MRDCINLLYFSIKIDSIHSLFHALHVVVRASVVHQERVWSSLLVWWKQQQQHDEMMMNMLFCDVANMMYVSFSVLPT